MRRSTLPPKKRFAYLLFLITIFCIAVFSAHYIGANVWYILGALLLLILVIAGSP